MGMLEEGRREGKAESIGVNGNREGIFRSVAVEVLLRWRNTSKNK